MSETRPPEYPGWELRPKQSSTLVVDDPGLDDSSRPTNPVAVFEFANGSSDGGTTLPDRSVLEPPQRRRTRGSTRDDKLSLIGSLSAALCVALLLFGRLAPFSGMLGFVIVTYLVFLLVYATLTSLSHDGPAVRDRIMTVVLYTATTIMLMALISVVVFTLWRGRTALFHGNFFTQDMSNAGPLDPVTVGGIKHAIVGSLWMISIALVFTVPIGLTCAVYLQETRGRFARFVRTMVEAMTALPSIVAGLFIFATWILLLHFQKSAFAAALALSVMMLPIIIRASDVVLRLVPGSLREASAALGAPAWRTVWHVVLPTARSGLATAVILGTARGIGETSPVLLTAGSTAVLNKNPFSGPMVSLPLAVFNFVRSPQKAMIARGFAAAAFLLLLVLTLFIIARIIGGRGAGQLSKRQMKRVRRNSARDADRFADAADARAAQGYALNGHAAGTVS